MKTKNLMLVIGMIACCYSYSQVKQEPKGNVPKLIFDKTVFDFGELKLNVPASCKFKFYNKGNAPLIIAEVAATCGCTVPSWPRTPVMPGDSGIIQVNYDTEESGAFDKLITVFSNASKMPISLTLKGRVTEK